MTENTNLGYRTPPALQSDSPLSAKGRFGRLSYLAWLFVASVLVYVAVFVVAIIFGVSTAAIGQAESGALGGISGIAILIFAALYIALLYFMFVFTIRRLHDVNKTGWLSLLFIVPLVNIIFGLYLLFAKGTQGVNNYGPRRVTLGWEKVVGWIYIALTIVSLVAVLLFGGTIINALSQTSKLDQSGYSEQIDYSQISNGDVTSGHETITEAPDSSEQSTSTEPAASTEQPANNP